MPNAMASGIATVDETRPAATSLRTTAALNIDCRSAFAPDPIRLLIQAARILARAKRRLDAPSLVLRGLFRLCLARNEKRKRPCIARDVGRLQFGLGVGDLVRHHAVIEKIP